MSGASVVASWTCTGANCPWGDALSNNAIAWPSSAAPSRARLGYTTNPPVYLSAAQSNGIRLTIDSGIASVFAGDPGADSHFFLGTVEAGDSFDVAGLDPNEVLSVQSEDRFTFHITQTPPPDPNDPGEPEEPEEPDEEDPPVVPPGSTGSVDAIWNCTSSPCPWGSTLFGTAAAWPTDAAPTTARLGYTATSGVYLPSGKANGAVVTLTAGDASLFAGRPTGDTHRLLANMTAGRTVTVTGLAGGEVLSLQSDDDFAFHATLPAVPLPTDPLPPENPTLPGATEIHSTQAFWRCNTPVCFTGDWVSAVISWPSFSAHQSNGRQGDLSRSVFSANNTALFPYMGPWANGCEVTAHSGTVLIIEWQRGTNVWRETFLSAGQKHTIRLTPPENGAMVESFDNSPGFSVSFKNCTPLPILQ